MKKAAAFFLSAWIGAFGWCAACAGPARADDIATKIEAARATYAKGDAIAALTALQDAADMLSEHLSDQFGKMLPPVPAGWTAGDVDSQPLDEAGGGLTVTRGYQKNDAALNASLIIDNPAIATAQALFKPAQPAPNNQDWQPVKINGEPWLLRYNKDMHEGEVMAVLNARALIQIEGTEIGDSTILIETAKGWNVAGIRHLLGL